MIIIYKKVRIKRR